MNIKKVGNQNKKRVIELVELISKELQIDNALIYYFLISDLERILREKIQLHKNKLKVLELECDNLNEKENSLLRSITIKERDISIFETKIANLKEKLIKIENQYATLQSELIELETQLKDVTKKVEITNTQVKQNNYNLIMKKHKINEKTNLSLKTLSWVLTLFTVIAVILTLILILKK